LSLICLLSLREYFLIISWVTATESIQQKTKNYRLSLFIIPGHTKNYRHRL